MLGNGSETVWGNRDRTSLSRFQEIYVGANVFNFGKGAFEFFLSLLGLPANLPLVGIPKHFAQDRSALVVFSRNSNVLKKGTNFSKSFRFSSKTATALCWGTETVCINKDRIGP